MSVQAFKEQQQQQNYAILVKVKVFFQAINVNIKSVGSFLFNLLHHLSIGLANICGKM